MKRIFLLLAALGLTGGAMAAGTISEARMVAANSTLAARLPAPVDFTVSTAGPVTVTLADLQSQVAFSSLQAVVTRGATKVLTLSSPGTQQFQATAGDYRVQVIGKVPSSYGIFRVDVRTASNQVLALSSAQISSGATVSSGSTPPRYTLQPGTYQVALRDSAFPAALQYADLAVFRVGSGAPVFLLSKANSAACVASACTGSFTVSQAGDYDFAVAAAADTTATRGLYTLSITGNTGAVIAADAYAVGPFPDPTVVTLPAAADYTISLSDLFAATAPLADVRALLVQGANVMGSRIGAGSATATGGATGSARLYVLSTTGTSGVGAYAVQLRRVGGQLAFETASVLPTGLNDAQTAAGYRYDVNVPSTADYRLVLRDLLFPTAFTTLRAMVYQSGNLQTLAAPGTQTTPLVAGAASVLVIATKSAAADATLGIALEPVVGGNPLVSKAQGVGALFDSRPIQITQSGAYDLNVSDLQFPVALGELTVSVTKGPEMIGQIFGSSGFNFTAQPGEYSINLSGKPAAGADYGTWAFAVTPTAPPVVTLTANPASVPAQGTSTLTWSSTGATSCTASGGWSGSRTNSGSAVTAALTAQTSFTLACTGAGGTTSASAVVDLLASSAGSGSGSGSGSSSSSGGGGGGGGEVDLLLIGLCSALLFARRRTS